MTNKKQIADIALATKIIPRLMNCFLGSFKPQLDMPIKKNELRTLVELKINPNEPMKFYIDAVDMENGSFTYLADQLEKKGLIIKTTAQDDKRKTVMHLTDEGDKITQLIMIKFDTHIRNLFSDLDANDLDELENSLHTLERIYTKIQTN